MDEIVEDADFATEAEARGALKTLDSMLSQSGKVTVADFCEVIGSSSDFDNDDAIGWTSFAGAEVVENNVGWSLRLPNPINVN